MPQLYLDIVRFLLLGGTMAPLRIPQLATDAMARQSKLWGEARPLKKGFLDRTLAGPLALAIFPERAKGQTQRILQHRHPNPPAPSWGMGWWTDPMFAQTKAPKSTGLWYNLRILQIGPKSSKCTVSIQHVRKTWGQLRPARPQLRPNLDPLGPNFGPAWLQNVAAGPQVGHIWEQLWTKLKVHMASTWRT